jgi:hypothetical protein
MGRAVMLARGAVQLKMRRHDIFATAADLDLPVLHSLQHEYATRGATAALIEALPRFLVAHGQGANGRKRPRAAPVVLNLRVSARFAVRSPNFLEGAILDRRAGARTRHNRNLTVSRPYIRV